MQTIPTNLSTEQAEKITEVLKEAKRFLDDAASPSPIHTLSYWRPAEKIGVLLTEFGVDAE